MSAPIRDEHRQAARALIHALVTERLNEIGGVVGYYVEMSGEEGEINEEAVAAVLADRDEAATSALRAEHATLTRALRRAQWELETWRDAVGVEAEWGGVSVRLTHEAIGVSRAALSLPLAKEVEDA